MPLRLRHIMLLCLWGVMLCGTLLPQATAQVFRLQMWSDPGDWIGLGQTYDFTSQTGTFTATVERRNNSLQANYLTINYFEPNYRNRFNLEFTTHQLGIPLQVGQFRNAERAPFARPGHPGLNVAGNGRGNNELRGSFRILEIALDESGATPRVSRFVAYFVQYGEANAPALRGLIQYNAPPPTTSDTTPPVTTASRSGNVITLSAVGLDAADDVASSFYQIEGGFVFTYEKPFRVYGAPGQVHTITYWSRDLANNQEPPKTLRFALEDTGLSTSFQLWSTPGEWIGQGRTFTLNRNNGTFDAYVGNNRAGFPASVPIRFYERFNTGGFGTLWVFHMRAAENGGVLQSGYYGNASASSYRPDDAPLVEFYGDGRGVGASNGAFWVHDIEYDLTGTEPQLVRLAASFAQHAPGSPSPLFGRVRYNSTADVPDVMPPYTMARLLDHSSSGWYRPGLTFPLMAGSFLNGSAVAATYYQIDNTSPLRYLGGNLRFDQEGIFRLRFWSVDAAGRIEPTNSMPVRIDGTPPELTLRAKVISTTRNTATLEISGRATDRLSGIDFPYLQGDVEQLGFEGWNSLFAALQPDGSFTTRITVPYRRSMQSGVKFVITAYMGDKVNNTVWAEATVGFSSLRK